MHAARPACATSVALPPPRPLRTEAPSLPRRARRPPVRPASPVDPASARSFALQGLVFQILVMKLVAELVTFRGEVARVLLRRRRLDRHLLDHLETEPLDTGDLLRIVRKDADRRQAELREDLVADPVVAHVRLKPELEVRFHRVEAVLLELVGAQLVEKTDAAAFLGHVEQHAALLAGDLLERLLELLAAVAAQRMEDVAGQALGMHTHEDVLGTLDIALHERNVMLAGQRLAERDSREVSVRGWHRDG